jgi:two-component system cell cycle sensor histidine kinase/response regulator CckA
MSLHQPSSTASSAAEPPPLPVASLLQERDQRLQALKSLVGRLAHDFNNSLVPLVGYITLLREELKQGGPGNQYLVKLENSVRKTEELVDTILQATHPERQFSPRRIDLTALMQRLLEGWMKALPSATLILVETDLAPCTLWLDEAQWTKVIQHLLRNAQAALAEGGTLKISLRSRLLNARQAADLGTSDVNVVELIFEDTGCGMSDEVLRQACEPFFSTSSQSSTAGLGLTMVHSVVRLHGGQMVVESADDRGTRVAIWLPASGC